MTSAQRSREATAHLLRRVLVIFGLVLAAATVPAHGPQARAAGGANSGSPIACPSNGWCMALAGSLWRSATWNGTSWTSHSLPKPRGADLSPTLAGVDCRGRSMCIAVGSYLVKVSGGGERFRGLIERWNGAKWSTMSAPTMSSSTMNVELKDVSCASTTRCYAVGLADSDSAPPQPRFIRWDGKTWQTANAHVGSGAALFGVSCRSLSWCVAVGYSARTTQLAELPLARTWRSHTWSGSRNILGSVACSSTSTCAAVSSGDIPEIGAVRRFASGKWTSYRPPAGALMGVGCPTTSLCLINGQSSNYAAFSLALRGTGLKRVTLPVPDGSESSDYGAISCATSTYCVSIGYAASSNGGTQLAARWNGNAWVAMPAPTGWL